ncbi:MAG: transcription termination/antitermination protein NusA [Parcubacteria group bacterium]|nr:transcription termination/antitermination protein NusA [Parcubacteria group bacterium]
MFDLKIINSVIDQLEEERGIPREKTLEAIESSLATAYKKEYGKRGQIVRAVFDINSGKTEFHQVKIVVDESMVKMEEENVEETEEEATDERVRFNPEHHIFLEDAIKMKKDAKLDDELIFPLEEKEDFGRIAAQTAKQIIMQKIREAEKVSVLDEFGQRQGEIVNGTVQRIERGNIFVDFGRATGLLSYDEQIKGENYKQGERIRAYLSSVEESPRGVFLRLSRTHPKFLEKLFEIETPELSAKTVEIKAVAREAGSRSKIAISSNDDNIDPVGSLVGQRGVRVSTVMSELGGEKIDVIEWSEDPVQFIEDSLSPAAILNVVIDEEEKKAVVEVSEDQQSLAIGKGGQNVRLAAKLTGWKIDIKSTDLPSQTEESDKTDKNTEEKETKEESKAEAPKEEQEAEEEK